MSLKDKFLATVPYSTNRWDCKWFMTIVGLYLAAVICFVYILPQLDLPSEQFFAVESAAFGMTLLVGWLVGLRDNGEGASC